MRIRTLIHQKRERQKEKQEEGGGGAKKSAIGLVSASRLIKWFTKLVADKLPSFQDIKVYSGTNTR